MTARRSGLCWLGLAAAFVLLDTILFSLLRPGVDWAPLWAAGQLAWSDPSQIYGFDLVSKLQSPFTGIDSGRPYVYPPSALLLIAPLALLPFWVSFMVFVLTAMGLLAWAAAKQRIDLLLLLIAPPVVIAAISGQPTLLATGLILLGLSALGRNDWRAGLFLALAAAIKPQLLILAPFALIGGRHWRAIGAGSVVGLMLLACSLAIFGLGIWLDWLKALPRFQSLFADFDPLIRNAVSPYATAARHGFESQWIIAAAAALAIPCCAIVFARSEDLGVRSIALLGGALLISPYSMNYELALLAPAMIMLPREKLRDLAIPLLWGASLFANAAVVGLLAAYGWMLWTLRAGKVSAPNQPPVQRGIYVPA